MSMLTDGSEPRAPRKRSARQDDSMDLMSLGLSPVPCFPGPLVIWIARRHVPALIDTPCPRDTRGINWGGEKMPQRWRLIMSGGP